MAWVGNAWFTRENRDSETWRMLTLPADIFPQRVVGSVTGIQGLSIAASAIAQLTIGFVVATYSYAPVFTVAGLLHPTAAIVLLLLLGRIQRIDESHGAGTRAEQRSVEDNRACDRSRA